MNASQLALWESSSPPHLPTLGPSSLRRGEGHREDSWLQAYPTALFSFTLPAVCTVAHPRVHTFLLADGEAAQDIWACGSCSLCSCCTIVARSSLAPLPRDPSPLDGELPEGLAEPFQLQALHIW